MEIMRGIMSAMSDPIEDTQSPMPQGGSEDENKAFETQPIGLDHPGEAQNSGLEETSATSIVHPHDEDFDEILADTLAGESLKGFEDTLSVPLVADTANTQSTPTKAPENGQKQPTSPAVKKPAAKTGRSWIFLTILGLVILMGFLLASGFGGYAAGINQRKSAEKTQVARVVVEQFQLGVQEMEQGAYSRARQRFEYVIQLDPGYPGASEKLSEVLLEINTTATPTLLPTTTLTPTPDLRDVQQFFDQAQQAISASDWNTAIESLLTLRKTDAAFHAVDVDGMLFLSLRNRGKDKILKEADLEGGIYDLTLAKKFGPLDAEAEGFLSWSSMYITGASFWGIDWEQAVNYFSQVAPQLPNLTDGSGMTATERLRVALFEYGNTLAANGQYCKAVRAYQDLIAIAPNAEVQQAGELAAKGCEQGEAPQAQSTPKPGKKPKVTTIP